ncbi:MAG: spore germination protein [Clostridiaceae bacterium]
MSKNKSVFKTIFLWLDYKEKAPPSFYIPEAANNSSDETGNNTNADKDASLKEAGSGKPPKEAGADSGKSPDCVPPENRSESGNSANQQNTRSRRRKRGIINSKPVNQDNGKVNEPGLSGGAVKNNESAASNKTSGSGSKPGDSTNTCISSEIGANLSYLEKAFNSPENKDIIIRRICIGEGTNAFIFYMDGMADRNTINQSILKPLLDRSRFTNTNGKSLFDYTYDSVIETHQIKVAIIQEEAINSILAGDTGIFIDSFPFYMLCETKGYEKRSVEKPQVEGVVKGPQEAFNENLRTNITLIRRILKNRALTTEFYDVGKRNNAKCAVLYLKDLTNPAIVNEVARRIKSIDTDLIMGVGILEQFIEDHPLSIIPTIISTERPDRTASHLVEGKVAILADGAPFALIVPAMIADFFHTPEDAALRWQYGTFLRFIRIFTAFISSMLPGLYVALTTFHSEMIPTDLLIAIAKARENVPFPTIVELLLMEVSFELIREAGIRIPGIIGNTIGIIGALILGQAAVQANLVSPVMIIIVAFTGLGNFAIPDFSMAFGARVMRMFYVFAGAVLGFYGISLALMISFAYMVSTKSFGVPIFSTIAPKTHRSFDFFIKWPVWKQELRPDYLNPLDITRQPKISRKWTKARSNIKKNGNNGNNQGKPGNSGRKDGSNEQ